MNYPNEQGWKLVGLALMILSALIMVFCIIGIYDCFWNVPAKNGQIFKLSQNNELLLAENQKLKMGMRFENLFTLFADPNQMIDFSELEKYICEKRGFCLGEVSSNGEINKFNK